MIRNVIMPERIVYFNIVLCSYNGSTFIRQQLISILEQQYPFWHLYVFDDSSSDTTVDILTQFADFSEKITVLPPLHTNQGVLASFLNISKP